MPWLRKDQSAIRSRPPLRQPKCALGDEPQSANASLHTQNEDLIKKALQDLNAFSTEQMTELVAGICERATQGEPVVHLCLFLIAKYSDGKFLNTLLSTCSEWLDKRDQFLRPLNKLEPVQHRWRVFVSFVDQLLLWLPRRSRDEHMKHGILFLAKLLCKCCHDILETLSLGSTSEMECLRSVLTSTGKAIEHVDPDLMKSLVQRMREALLEPELSALGRKTLLQLIELRASGWQLNRAQQKYYDDTQVEVETDLSEIVHFTGSLFHLAAFLS
ncbi:MIF4G domain-containing protein B-like [Amblyomma americanum]